MVKKSLSFILMLGILLSLCTFTANAAADVAISITAPSKAIQGQEVTISVSADISAGTQIQGILTEFEFSDGFPIDGAAFEITENTTGWTGTNVGISKHNLLGFGAVNANGGKLAGAIKFNIPEAAAIGTEYTFSITVVEAVLSDGTATNNYTLTPSSVTVEVVDLPPIEGVSITGKTATYDGNNHTVTAVIPSGVTVKYGTTAGTYNLSTAPSYKDAGSYTVYYQATQPQHSTLTGSVNIIIGRRIISEVSDIPAQGYTGSKITPTVTVKDRGTLLVKDTDYTLTYGENTNAATGGSVTVKGIGNYDGTVTKNFAITPIDMTVATQNVNVTYDGENHKASVTVTKPTNAVVKYGTTAGTYNLDAMPEYKNAGTYTVYYKATAANYNDAADSVTVAINKKTLTADMVSDIPAQAYTGSQLTPAVTVADGELLTASDYDITYGENINVATGGSVTVTAKGNYTGTVTKSFAITPIDMTVVTENAAATYDGNNYKAAVTVTNPANAVVKYGTTAGTYNLDAMPEYKNAGTYTVYYKATAANYKDTTGSVTVTISPKVLTDDMLESISAQEYTGSQIKPAVTLRDTLPCVIEPADYDVAYGENINVSTGGSVTVTGKRNYTGTVTKSFEIAHAVIRTEKDDYSGTYDGANHTGAVRVLNCDTATVTYGEAEGTYNLDTIPQYKNAGNYVVYYKASAENFSTATGSFTVTISPKALTEDMVGTASDAVYAGVQITPDIAVADGELLTAEDYDVAYGANLNVADEGSVTVTAKRNYEGTVTRTFAITKADLTITSENVTAVYGDAFTVPVNYAGFKGTDTTASLTAPAVAGGYPADPDAGEYNITLSGAAADNYNIIYSGEYTLTITKRDATLTALSVFDKIYDGETAAVINETTAVIEGILAGDSVQIDIENAAASFVSADIADGVEVTIAGLALKGDDAANYSLTNTGITTTADIKADITAAEVAAQITALAIDRTDSTLPLPTLPESFTAALKSSDNEAVIAADGTITSQDTDAAVNIVLTITDTRTGETADTAVITVTVPAGGRKLVALTAGVGGTVTGDGEFDRGTDVTITAVPLDTHYFIGWYDGETLVSSDASYTFTLENDVTLEARFGEYLVATVKAPTTVYYKVSFNSNGGSDVASVSVEGGKTAGAIPEPEKEGYLFGGWYTDKDLIFAFDFTTKIYKSYTLYAKWDEITEDTVLPGDEDKEPVVYSDVPITEWFYKAVDFVSENGLMNGVSGGKFAPNGTLTRAMLVTILHRLEGEPESNISPFSDVADDAWYAKAVAWAAENSIVNGVGEGRFAPDDSITREQIAAILFAYARAVGEDTSLTADLSSFTDADEISDWAKDGFSWAVAAELISGKGNGILDPKGNATRAEIAAILMRYLSR